MTRNVNASYSKDAAKEGSTIDIEVPTAIGTRAVTPAATPPSASDYTPTIVQIALDQWRQNDPIVLTDKEMREIDTRKQFLPPAMKEAVSALGNELNEYLFSKYTGIYGWAGSDSAVPFASNADALIDSRKVLNEQRCPRTGRLSVMDADAEANALGLAAFADASQTGEDGVKIEGDLGRKYGFHNYYDEAVPTHTAGTASGTLVNSASVAIGDTSVACDTGSGTLVVGDIFTVAGDTQTYVVTAAVADVSSGTIAFAPAAKVAWANNAAITVKGDHVVNLAFHPNAFGFASRRLAASFLNGNRELVVVDPVCQIALRLELSRQHKRDCWEFDLLYGASLVDARLATRMAGQA